MMTIRGMSKRLRSAAHLATMLALGAGGAYAAVVCHVVASCPHASYPDCINPTVPPITTSKWYCCALDTVS
jgi:hypothetical protein